MIKKRRKKTTKFRLSRSTMPSVCVCLVNIFYVPIDHAHTQNIQRRVQNIIFGKINSVSIFRYHENHYDRTRKSSLNSVLGSLYVIRIRFRFFRCWTCINEWRLGDFFVCVSCTCTTSYTWNCHHYFRKDGYILYIDLWFCTPSMSVNEMIFYNL